MQENTGCVKEALRPTSVMIALELYETLIALISIVQILRVVWFNEVILSPRGE